ncbi:MAG TPA: hypothetical protein VNI77_01245, partial [Nitrososphaera sp.]|nr:hypothetical protein [Nitrososphaera sp.]
VIEQFYSVTTSSSSCRGEGMEGSQYSHIHIHTYTYVHTYRRRSMVQRGLQRVAAPMPLCIWYRTEEEEPDVAVYPAGQGQDRMFRRPLCMQKEELQQAACGELAEALLAIVTYGNRQEKIHVISGQGWG